jgi:predicted amidohydrolase YtcJ
MQKIIYFLFISLFLASCFKGKNADLIIFNAKIHTMDDGDHVVQAMAIKDGKILEVGPDRQIMNKYAASDNVDGEGKDIYPGFTDSHGHILSLVKQRLSANLVGSSSLNEVLVRMEKYAAKSKSEYIVGKGWDQSLWGEKELPNNEKLNELFPDRAVALYRIDGHAILVNDFFLKKVGITAETKVSGGMIILKDGKCTGLLVDNAMDKISNMIPDFTDKQKMEAIIEIQEELFQYGITAVHEAGITFNDIALFKKMIDDGTLHLEIYAMLMPTPDNFKFVEKNGIYKHKNLSIRSFKVFADGALGSRGACLKHAYSDMPGHFGMLTTTSNEINRIAEFCSKHKYQMNTHAIGDSTNRIIIDVLTRESKLNPGHRWRIEHAQILDLKDIERLKGSGAIPSVQPTHAVSDMRWAEDRLGKERMKGAYAYKSLINQCGMIAIGTDFPIEHFNPFLTIHAAVERKNNENIPGGGFGYDEAISFNDCIKGMTSWASLAAFEETRLGSLEAGKDATFAIFELPVRSSSMFQENFSKMTFIKGKKVYSAE